MENPSRDADIRMRGFRRKHDVEEMIQLIDGRVIRLGSERVSAICATGRVLAEAVFSPVDVPGYARAAMDGYAIHGEESFGASGYNELAFQVVGQSLPGRPFGGVLRPGQAVRITTGAPMPAGSDAVALAETVRETNGIAYLSEPVAPARNVGRIGEDIPAGSELFRPPRVLRPQDIAALVSVGIQSIAVVRRPKVDILATGDELLRAGSTPIAGRVVDSNSPMLASLVERDGGVPANRRPDFSFDILPDDPERIRAALRETDADLILLCGGSSVGIEDHGPRLVAELGELPIHGLNLRPAAPAGLGFIRNRPVFLMPGNPVSCLCAYDLLARRALRILAGRDLGPPYRTATATLAVKLVSAVGRLDYVRVRWLEGGKIEPIAVSGAGILSSTVKADGFVLVPKDSEGAPPGAEVDVFLYDP